MPMIRILAALALAAVVPTAHADTELRDRFIAASQQMGENMMEVVQACAPDLDLSEVNFDYTPGMVEATECVVDTHIERFGRSETEELVEQAEAMAERSFSSLQEMTTFQQEYPQLSRPELVEINQSCGTLEASNDLPMNRIMRENMMQLMECFSQEQ